jgi:hypothetical protein
VPGFAVRAIGTPGERRHHDKTVRDAGKRVHATAAAVCLYASTSRQADR